MKKPTGDYLTILKRVKAYRENAKHPLSKDAKAQLESANKSKE